MAAGRGLAHVGPELPPGLLADTLGNGLTVFVYEDHAAPTVALQTWVRAGTADERPGLYGVAHLVEHLQFVRGGSGGPYIFDRVLGPLGAEFDAETGRDATVFRTNVPADAWKLALALETGRLAQPPAVADSLFRREKAVLDAEVRGAAGRLDRVTWRLMSAALFPDHPYGPAGLVPDSDLGRLEMEDARGFFTGRYRPSRMALVIVGDLEGAEALAEIRRLAEGLAPAAETSAAAGAGQSGGGAGPDFPALPEHGLPAPRERDIRVNRAGNSSQLQVGFSVPASTDSTWVVWPLIADILGGGRAALLNRTLVDSLGLAWDCGCRYEGGGQGGMMVLSATLPPQGDLERARREMAAVLDRLAAAGPPRGLLERGRRRLAGLAALTLATHEGLATAIGEAWQLKRQWAGPVAVGTVPGAETIRRAVGLLAGPERRVWLEVVGETERLGEDGEDE